MFSQGIYYYALLQYDPETAQMTYDFAVRSDVVVVDTNPEMADVSNPRGEIYGEAYYIVGTAEDGSRIAHRVSATTSYGRVLTEVTPDRLMRLAERLNEERPALNPDLWDDIDPAYGSEAYIRGGYEQAYADMEARQG